MDTLIITGGAGFIGSNFVRLALAETGLRVVVLDKLTYAGNLCSLEDVSRHPHFVFLQIDIIDRSAVEQVFREFQPLALVNFAAETHVDRSIDDPRPFVETNVVGTFVLLEAARKFLGSRESSVRARFRFLHVSTDEVYGTLGESGFFTEETPYAPNSPYAASKAAADHLVRAYNETYGVLTLITNCSNNFGPYQYLEKLIPLMVLNAVDGRKLPIYGDGGNIRDWLFVEDHCSGILTVLQHGRAGEKYNLGGGNERTNLQIVDEICACLEKILPASGNPAMLRQGMLRYEQLKNFVPDRPGHDRRYALDASKVRRELGWVAAHNMDAGLAKTVQWYVEHGDWCRKVQSCKYSRERLGLATESS